MSKPDGKVDPQGATIRSLRVKIKKGLTLDAFLAIMGNVNSTVVKTYYPLFINQLPRYQINTPLRMAHFLAQVGHESMSLIFTEETASGNAYEGRKDLGNIEKGDGARFKG